jgi:methylmalonyl-CoA/ethylmalonyl-CoA epimerase
MFTEIDHIGIAVEDVEQAVAFYEQAFGVGEWERIEMPERHMRVAARRIGHSMIEFIAPTSEEASFARHLRDKGPGIHHIAYRVEDIEASLEELKARGVRLIDNEPRPGLHNTRVAFLHPKNGKQGVLVELVQHTEAGH